MKDETRKSIGDWKVSAEKEINPFIKFFILYMCLDAWMSSESMARTEPAKWKWLNRKDNPLKAHFYSKSQNREPLVGLIQIGKIYDMRPWVEEGKHVSFERLNSFSQLTDFIYHIRCNLFHGGKSPTSHEDKKRVSLAGEILEDWVSWIISHTS